MKFITTLQQDEDGIWIAECPAIPGCVSQGKTQQEATANLREAMQACLAVRSAQGMPLVVETREIENAIEALPLPQRLQLYRDLPSLIGRKPEDLEWQRASLENFFTDDSSDDAVYNQL